jgi:predicted ATPase
MLYGREAERAAVAELLDGARGSRSGVLVVRGEAGIGKSALLEAARAAASDMRILSAQGVESEAPLPFAGLHQRLRPELGRLGRLPAPQAAALRGALGLGPAAGEQGRFLVSLAVLSLLADAAEPGPLVCLVDDAHWIDDASADALVFVARRLEAEAIVLLFAARDGERRRFEAPGLPELPLGGLGAEDAAAMLDRNDDGALAPAVRARILDSAAWNPLALIELPRSLSGAQRSGAEPLLAPLPVGARVEQEFLDRVRRLPDDTQTLLLVAAAEDTGTLATVLHATHRLGARGEAMDAAERAELVEVRGPRIAFRHPLVRSAVYQGATLSQRQAAHLALAEALQGDADADRRAWHRAAATVEPDASVADELEEAAGRARRRNASPPPPWPSSALRPSAPSPPTAHGG